MNGAKQMQALVWEGPRQLNIREVPRPKPKNGEILIQVAFSGICGSELGGYLGHNSLRIPPLIMGHEFSGQIVALGEGLSDANDHPLGELSIGKKVTVNPLLHDPWSRASLRGRQNLCRSRQIIGIHRPGSYAAYVVAPATNVYPLPDSLSLEHAALAEPLACAMRSAKLSGCTATDVLLIIGLGPIGLFIMQVAQQMGVRTILASDTDPHRREIGKHFGIHVIDPLTESVVDIAHEFNHGEGVDMAIDAVGAHVTRRECIESVAPGGRVIFTGLHEEESLLQANWIIRQELNVQGSFAYTTKDFEDALKWLVTKRVEIDPWLLKAPLSQGRDCFERLLDQPGPVAKILLHL